MKDTPQEFIGFDYPAEQISKFIAAGDTFTMLLKDGSIVHHTTKQHVSFKEWLIKNNIEDIKGYTSSGAIRQNTKKMKGANPKILPRSY